MSTLSTVHRRQLARTVGEVRRICDRVVRESLDELTFRESRDRLDSPLERRRSQKELLDALCDLISCDVQDLDLTVIDDLTSKCAFQLWHTRFFARFLAENDLLVDVDGGRSISLAECEKLANTSSSGKWQIVLEFASKMLPETIQLGHPAFRLPGLSKLLRRIDALLDLLPHQLFLTTDALGWAYQYWQRPRKETINRLGGKIGAAELAPITQLFTESYMVQFLLQNALGKWWIQTQPDRPCPFNLDYLKRESDSDGLDFSYEGWSEDLSGLRVLDPCCGSGHILVECFLLLVPMRMALDSLSARDAIDAVVRENLHGLEIDDDCLIVAKFALALEAWRYPDSGGFRRLPPFNLAWCGYQIDPDEEQRHEVPGYGDRKEMELSGLYDMLAQAPLLGSLVDPKRICKQDLFTSHSDPLNLIESTLRQSSTDSCGGPAFDSNLANLRSTFELLSKNYQLVVTNVPFLGREKQDPKLREFCDEHFPESKHDLAAVFLDRIMDLLDPEGLALVVLPQYLLFLSRYEKFRRKLLTNHSWNLLCSLGSGAFESVSGEVVKTCLAAIRPDKPENDQHQFSWIDATQANGLEAKQELLIEEPGRALSQSDQSLNPHSIIGYEPAFAHSYLEDYATSYQGLATSDNAQFVFNFWEVERVDNGWEFLQFAPSTTAPVNGCSHILLWEEGEGRYSNHAAALKQEGRLGGWKSGHKAWGRSGVAVNRMSGLPVSYYFGTKFDCNVAVLIPNDEKDLQSIWEYCASDEYHKEVRKINGKLSVTNSTLAKVPFDREAWRKRARRSSVDFPSGIESDDPTQWMFHGHPRFSTSPLQVAVVRMLGYRWPAESNSKLVVTPRSRRLAKEIGTKSQHDSPNGIVCLSALNGEPSGAERLERVLQLVYENEWNEEQLTRLLKEQRAESLDCWLRNHFFREHCKLFQQRPFVWHIWDGFEQDGFHALVNYHRLADSGNGKCLLDTLIRDYLDEWINLICTTARHQDTRVVRRLDAALRLKERLRAILSGDPPFDLFVRWKSLAEQPVGWSPDVNDGVRINIRPFLMNEPTTKRNGSAILRTKPNIRWNCDRGREPHRNHDQFPWFWEAGSFTGRRVNDIHIEKHYKSDGNTAS